MISFNPDHLLHHSLPKITIDRTECTPILEVQISYQAILGQVIRFFFMFTPAFIVAVIQFFDYMTLKAKKGRDDESFKSYLYLHKLQTLLSYHFMHSLMINLIIFVLQSDGFNQIVTVLDPKREIVLFNDFEKIKAEGIFHPLLGFILYWCAFSVVSLASFFLSGIFNFLSLLIQKFLFKILSFLRANILHKFFAFVHLIVTMLMGVLATTLTHCGLFYGELIRLASENPVYSLESEHIYFCFEQTRLLMIYFLLVLNIPSVIVWTKSLNSNEIRPLFSFMPDSGTSVAVLSIILHQMNYFKRILHVKLFDLKDEGLAFMVLVNSILTILYSSVNMYRLQYFILMHLFLMNFNSMKTKAQDKPKKE